MGFSSKWISWIRWCISTIRFSILVNGCSSGFFQSSKGLRQREPLSPYLFILAMELFPISLRGLRRIDDFLVRGRDGVGVEVSHLLFPNITLILGDASKENLEYLS